MPTVIFKVDCGKSDQPIKHDLHTLENKVQEALAELDYDYLVFETIAKEESLLDLEYPEELQQAVG